MNNNTSLSIMKESLRRHGGVVAIFGDLSSEFVQLKILTDGMVKIGSFDDGAIYGYP
jgi:hypothetical protein